MKARRVIGLTGTPAPNGYMDLWSEIYLLDRGERLGRTLVTLLRNEALRRGAIPYYGTSLSNLPSWRIALGSGFYPLWVETESREDEDNSFVK